MHGLRHPANPAEIEGQDPLNESHRGAKEVHSQKGHLDSGLGPDDRKGLWGSFWDPLVPLMWALGSFLGAPWIAFGGSLGSLCGPQCALARRTHGFPFSPLPLPMFNHLQPKTLSLKGTHHKQENPGSLTMGGSGGA